MLAPLAAVLLLGAAPAAQSTQPASAQPAFTPRRIPAPGGEVIIASAGQQRAYDEIKFAPARRAGDTLYVSGVIAGRAPGEGTDAEALKTASRRAFRSLERTLKAAGAGFEDVVMINTFHVWTGQNFSGTRDEHLQAFSAVKDEFMRAPHPAWTAVGTTGLLGDGGHVEIQMIAHVPSGRQAPTGK